MQIAPRRGGRFFPSCMPISGLLSFADQSQAHVFWPAMAGRPVRSAAQQRGVDMVIWAMTVGAVLGLCWPGNGLWGLFFGALLGFIAGASLRSVVRREIAAALARLQKTAVLAMPPGNPVAANKLPAAAVAVAVVEPVAARQPLTDAVALDAARAALKDASAPPQPVRDAAVSPPASARAVPPSPIPPNAIDQALQAAQAWLLGGNTIVRVGLVILFIGLSFLARYAAVAGLFPVELRLAAIGAAGIALLGVGFQKRSVKPAFALVLQGAGVAVMYLTVFAAFRLYGLVPALAAFALMGVVCALGCALALLQNTRSLAVAAFAGGFAVPLLLSTGQGSHVGLFSYYLLLNVALVFIAWRRSWRVLNLVGFVATFGVATAWGVLKYTPDHYASAQAFLAAFVLIYVLTAVLYARNTPTRFQADVQGAVDSTLVFGTPLAGFALQSGLVQSFALGAAFSALALGAAYLGMAAWLVRRAGVGHFRLLIECFIALGVGFATLAVPLGLDARLTSAVWALEGAGAFWVGMRQARWMPRAFGLALQAVAGLTFIATLDAMNGQIAPYPFINFGFVGALLVSLPAMGLAWWLRQSLPHSGSRWASRFAALERQLPSAVYLVGFGFWCLAWVLEVTRLVPAVEAGLAPAPVFSQLTAQLLLMVVLLGSFGLSQQLGLRTRWAVATWPSRWSLLVMALVYWMEAASGWRVLNTPAWALWPVALALHVWMMRCNDAAAAPSALSRRIHCGSVWLVTVLLADALWFWIGQGALWQTAWASVVMLISAIGILGALTGWAGRARHAAQLHRFAWPLKPHAAAYYWDAALPLALLVFAGALAVAVSSSGRTEPLPYIPLLNPTELTLALALTVLMFWRRTVQTANPLPVTGRWLQWVVGREALVALAGLAFVVINTVWLRIAHHFFSVPWDASSLFASFVVQTGYAILWTALALSVMVLAHRRPQRALWLTGAALLGLVVVKLLLVDLSNVGGAERIITFIGVGVLMLVVGYFAPLPPKALAVAVPERPELPPSALPLPADIATPPEPLNDK